MTENHEAYPLGNLADPDAAIDLDPEVVRAAVTKLEDERIMAQRERRRQAARRKRRNGNVVGTISDPIPMLDYIDLLEESGEL